jgi:hypothetical protein
MRFQPLLLLTLLGSSTAVIVDLFHDTNCQNPAGNRNVYDGSCAPLGSFSSFRITTNGGPGEQLSAYSRNACAGPVTACVQATVNGACVRATNNAGASNAMGSGLACGIV